MPSNNLDHAFKTNTRPDQSKDHNKARTMLVQDQHQGHQWTALSMETNVCAHEARSKYAALRME